MVTLAAPHTDLAPARIAAVYEAAAQLPDAAEEYERQVRRAYQAVVAPGDVVVDVGAYNGKHAIPLAFAVGQTGVVYAAEPNPAIHPVLRDRIAAAARLGLHVELFEGCVQDDPDAEVLQFQVIDSHPGWSALRPREGAPAATQVDVAATTLDRLVPAGVTDRLSFVKIDVEGAELAVLAGGARALGALPVHHVEMSLDGVAAHGYSVDDLVGFYADDYVVLDVLGFTLADRDALAASFTAPGVYDYLAIPRAHPRAGELWSAVRAALLRGFAAFEPALPATRLAARSRYGPMTATGPRFRSSLPSIFPRATAVAFPQPPPLPTALVAQGSAVSALAGPPATVAVSPAGSLVTLGHGREFTVTVPGDGRVSVRVAALVDVFSASWSHQTLLALRTGDGVELVLRFFKPYEDPVIIVELLRLDGDKVRIASTGEVGFAAPQLDAEVRITRKGVVARVRLDPSRTVDLKAGYRLTTPTLTGKIGERLPPADPDPFRGAGLLATAVAGGGKRPAPPPPWNRRAARRGLRWLAVGSARRGRQLVQRALRR